MGGQLIGGAPTINVPLMNQLGRTSPRLGTMNAGRVSPRLSGTVNAGRASPRAGSPRGAASPAGSTIGGLTLPTVGGGLQLPSIQGTPSRGGNVFTLPTINQGGQFPSITLPGVMGSPQM